MTSNRLSILCVIAVFCCAAEVQGARGSAPEQIETLQRLGADAPFFVSARFATDESGQIRWSAFTDDNRMALKMRLDEMDRVRRLTATSGAPVSEACSTTTITFFHVSGPHRSWEELLEHADAVYRGRVVSTTPGFQSTTPETLLSVVIIDRIRRAQGFPAEGFVTILYPAADFTIGGTRFCNAGQNSPFIPAVGDEVLIFAYDKPADQSGTFLLTLPDQLIFGRDHRLIGRPNILGGKESSSIEDLARSVERHFVSFGGSR
jgi:hypothetical protein